MRDSPWFHQKRSESAPPAARARDAPSMSQKEQDEITARLSRPTESALYRQSLFWKLDSFMDKGFHSWSKMELFDDCKRCMWSKEGSIKTSCKIRPLNKNLPPLFNSREGVRSSQWRHFGGGDNNIARFRGQSRDSSRSSQDTLHTSFAPSTSRESLYFNKRSKNQPSKSANVNVGLCGSAYGSNRHRGLSPLNGSAMAGLAVPKIATRPMAAVGIRV